MATNLVASQALRGQGVKVTLSQNEFSAFLANPLTRIGAVMYILTTTSLGTIHSIDEFGSSYIVVPLMPNKSFSDSPGYLTEGAGVDFD
jgi:hypothetical protein